MCTSFWSCPITIQHNSHEWRHWADTWGQFKQNVSFMLSESFGATMSIFRVQHPLSSLPPIHEWGKYFKNQNNCWTSYDFHSFVHNFFFSEGNLCFIKKITFGMDVFGNNWFSWRQVAVSEFRSRTSAYKITDNFQVNSSILT